MSECGLMSINLKRKELDDTKAFMTCSCLSFGKAHPLNGALSNTRFRFGYKLANEARVAKSLFGKRNAKVPKLHLC